MKSLGYFFLERAFMRRLVERGMKALKRVHALQQARGFLKQEALMREKVGAVLRDAVVVGGPYAGMRYPALVSHGSVFYSKIFGTYELELAPFFTEGMGKGYTDVVDVGCAEGYHAVGLGRLYGCRVHAFDADPEARHACEQMAQANGVEVAVGGTCSVDALMALDLGQRALVLVDCEGCELELFTPEVARSLARHDVVVECHDFLHLGATERIRDVLGATHDVELVFSVHDDHKTYLYRVAQLEGFSLKERRYYVMEGRPGTMAWVVARSRG